MKQIKQYSLQEEIGRGGMSTVYRAYDPDHDKDVAIKLMHESLIGNEQAQTRFIKEVQTVISLDHPAIVPVLEYGTVDDRIYIVMECMTGGALRQRLNDGPLSLETSLMILRQVALALASAHKQHVIHRDVKPHNILLDEAGKAYLSDFGIARSMEGEGAGKTVTMIGTPEYVAPEQVINGQLSSKTDIYQLGVTLFHMMTGQLPFSGSAYHLMSHHVNDPLPSAEALNPLLPVGADAILRRATAKNPDDRFVSAEAFMNAFESLLENGTATNLLVWPIISQPHVASSASGRAAALEAKPRTPFLRRAMAWTAGGAVLGSMALFSMGILPNVFDAEPTRQTVQATEISPSNEGLEDVSVVEVADEAPILTTEDTATQLAVVTDEAEIEAEVVTSEVIVEEEAVVETIVEDTPTIDDTVDQLSDTVEIEATVVEAEVVVSEEASTVEMVVSEALENSTTASLATIDDNTEDNGDDSSEVVVEVVNETDETTGDDTTDSSDDNTGDDTTDTSEEEVAEETDNDDNQNNGNGRANNNGNQNGPGNGGGNGPDGGPRANGGGNGDGGNGGGRGNGGNGDNGDNGGGGRGGRGGRG